MQTAHAGLPVPVVSSVSSGFKQPLQYQPHRMIPTELLARSKCVAKASGMELQSTSECARCRIKLRAANIFDKYDMSLLVVKTLQKNDKHLLDAFVCQKGDARGSSEFVRQNYHKASSECIWHVVQAATVDDNVSQCLTSCENDNRRRYFRLYSAKYLVSATQKGRYENRHYKEVEHCNRVASAENDFLERKGATRKMNEDVHYNNRFYQDLLPLPLDIEIFDIYE